MYAGYFMYCSPGSVSGAGLGAGALAQETVGADC